ncbi:hypothetical protein Ahy_A06g025875 [Arachis hypogaea]|uniref:Replication factor A C-terminal domain-containing protein n=1 Tax=Arachis hypogaea TaxID=3818 RepID=A0A445CIW3_ARAHY|nr:hypothetical protein Ahy_A06g025875 [Arachis hypogaea]
MSYFSVVPNQGNYRTAKHEFKLVFLNRTTVIPVPDDAIPKTCFSFRPFDELLKMTEDYVYLVDVISLLTSVGEEKEYVKDGKVMKMIVLELSSKELTIRCALFGEYVDKVHHFLGSGYMEQPVVCFVGQVGLQNVMHATRLFFNPDLAEISMEHNHCLLLMRARVFHWKMILCVLLGDEGSFVVFGTVRSIVDEGPWWYSAYVCGKLIQPQGGAYYCDFCQHYVTNVTPRYKIKIAVEDDNGYGVFVLFDREAAYLLKKSCADLFGEVQKDASIDTKSVGADKYFGTFCVRRVCDDATIIAMFELHNYNADDERTPVKDGYLGKIPSSNHEYIVGKKDWCEVLDEGITSNGNSSNMKTNCKPLFDFLGEKGAKVPRLDDISSEADIMKEKGKTVDDSALVDRECSLEIEVLLNFSPIETTKETIYNPLMGEKVKRNLKKAFDDVADEELDPTFKVLKNRDL